MGVAIMASGTDASAYSNNYIPPVAGPIAWANLESGLLSSARRLKNWGSEGGAFTLSGDAALASVGVSSAGTADSRLTLSTSSRDIYTLVVLCDVGVDASILRLRDIRIGTNSSKQLVRWMAAGQTTSTITAPASGAFTVFLQGDTTGHRFGLISGGAVLAMTSTAVNTGTTSTYIGGLNASGVNKAWAGYGAAEYAKKLSDTELLMVSERLLARAKYLGVTVNG
ncbi:hypothetical protein SB6421_01546 [Klebsiella huaxiensis]|uniref:hypothetical protein n=1 Tax=Klebsiella huaxiensis TaxID=2153354 RepID=UPI0011589FDD|nr:hypothetical protein [Klebsiella huaxiensis]VUT16623.1 hypothetical protein SB6421_01546 [Klebsiella huaxiensis]